VNLKELIVNDLKKITTNSDEFAISATYEAENANYEVSGILKEIEARNRNDYIGVNEKQKEFLTQLDFTPKAGDYLLIDGTKYIITAFYKQIGHYKLIIEDNLPNYSHSHGRFR